jgi:competence protein ComGC
MHLLVLSVLLFLFLQQLSTHKNCIQSLFAPAEQMTWMHHDQSNEHKYVSRLGDIEKITIRCKKLAFVNSFMVEADTTHTC